MTVKQPSTGMGAKGQDMKRDVIGFVPARGGSKSVPLKNIAPLGKRPLLEYVIAAGKKSRTLRDVVCSTDHEKIADISRLAGARVDDRSEALSRDETPIVDVLIEFLKKTDKTGEDEPFALALLQPTSPFILPEHIDRCVAILKGDDSANSIQTVARFPHNFHAYNQRVVENGRVRFRFEKERMECYNKQAKPVFFLFGNLVIVKVEALMRHRNVFAHPSLSHEIPFSFALDVDGPEDFETAEWYLEKKKVVLPHMES